MKIGRYEVIRKLATGGMAEVFLAKAAGPLGFEKTLVVKRILPHLVDEPAFVEMFLAEAKLVAQLNHPHIVQIFDFGEADGAYFLAMEYIDGPNLRTLLKQARALDMRLSPALCAKMVAAACEGLAYAHDFRDPATQQPLNLIHRDISPDNILLSRQGAVKVADFGIAKVAGHGPQTKEGILKGKLPYMSPEHLRSQQLDRRADVYALGLVLYELLTCRKPFDVTTEAAILKAILFEPFIPAIERRPELPEHIQEILDRALAKERDARYPDCLAFQADLERFVISRGEALGSLPISRLITQLEADAEGKHPTAPPLAPAQPVPVAIAGPHTLSLPRADAAASESPTLPTNALRTIQQEKTVADRPQAGPSFPIPASAVALDETDLLEERMRSQRQKQVVILTIATLLIISGGGFLVLREESASHLQAQGEPPAFQLGTGSDAGSPPLETQPESDGGLPAELPVRPPAPMPAMAEADAGTPGPDLLPTPDDGPDPSHVPKPIAPRPKPLRPSSQVCSKTTSGKTLIAFRVHPYGTVSLDGKELGITPLAPIEVSSGRHTIRIVNQALSKTETLTVNVERGENCLIKHNFGKN